MATNKRKINSNTASNSKKKPRGKPFYTGDPRINRNGKPKGFDGFRELAKQIANSPVDENGNKDLTVVTKIMLEWATSKNWQCQKAFLEIAYGKVPDKLEQTVKNIIIEPPPMPKESDADDTAGD